MYNYNAHLASPSRGGCASGSCVLASACCSRSISGSTASATVFFCAATGFGSAATGSLALPQVSMMLLALPLLQMGFGLLPWVQALPQVDPLVQVGSLSLLDFQVMHPVLAFCLDLSLVLPRVQNFRW